MHELLPCQYSADRLLKLVYLTMTQSGHVCLTKLENTDKTPYYLFQLLDSKWVSSSKDILTFRKALVNPVTSLQFRKFVTMKGDLLENDVLFWQEIQKYKVYSQNAYACVWACVRVCIDESACASFL